MKILIDGYNLLPESVCKNREDLIRLIVSYRKKNEHEITIVFDGTHGGMGDYGRADTGSVEVIFTPLTVQADDHIEEILEKNGGQGVVVVSSDRRIQRAAKKAHSFWVYSKEFARKLGRQGSSEGRDEVPPWLEGRDEVYEVPKKGTKKKGTPNRASQEERRRLKKLEQL